MNTWRDKLTVLTVFACVAWVVFGFFMWRLEMERRENHGYESWSRFALGAPFRSHNEVPGLKDCRQCHDLKDHPILVPSRASDHVGK